MKQSSSAQTNYESLQTNRKNALEYAESIAASTPSEATTPMLPETLNSMEDLTSAIKILDEQKDNKLGITWYEDDKGNRIRDARNVTTDNTLLTADAGEKYAMQVLNETRGGILLLEQSDIPEAQKEEGKARLLMVAESALSENMDEFPSKIRSYNNALLDVLNNAGIENSAEKLNFAKEVANFQDDHKHIITLNRVADNKGEKHTVIEADVMLNGLTDEQETQYNAIAQAGDKVVSIKSDKTSANKSDKTSLKSRIAKTLGVKQKDKDKYAWYNELPEHKRKLIKSVASEIAAGKKVIPSQLREFIGIRNGYEKTTAVIEGKKAKVLTQNIHCGAPASKNKQGKEQITQENIEQLKGFTSNKKLNLNILTSTTTLRDESWISKQLNKASKKIKGIFISSSPINRFRLWTAPTKQKHFKQALVKIGKKLNSSSHSKKTLNLQKYLKTGKDALLEGAIKEIESLDSELQVGLKAAVKTREHLSHPNTRMGKNEKNSNVEISANMLIVDTSLKNDQQLGSIFDQNSKEELKNIITFCKSGKDRTGLVMLKASNLAASYELDLDESQSQKCLKTLAAGNHTQEMAGIQGGSTGCHSIKTSGKKLGVKGEFVLNPHDEQAIEGVINQKSSGFNSKIKKAKDKAEKEVAKFLVEDQTPEKVDTKQKKVIAEQQQKKQADQKQVVTTAKLSKSDKIVNTLQQQLSGTSQTPTITRNTIPYKNRSPSRSQ